MSCQQSESQPHRDTYMLANLFRYTNKGLFIEGVKFNQSVRDLLAPLGFFADLLFVARNSLAVLLHELIGHSNGNKLIPKRLTDTQQFYSFLSLLQQKQRFARIVNIFMILSDSNPRR